jgi:hypothetical protein
LLILCLVLLLAVVVALAFARRDRAPATSARAPAAPAGARWGPSPFGSGPVAPAQATVGAAGTAEPVAAAPPAPALSDWDLDFKSARARFDELRWFGDDAASLVQQARQAEERLPTLLAQGTIGADVALLLKTDLLEVLEPDAKRRREQLIAWWSRHPLPRPSEQLAAYRRDEAFRREESLLLEWQTQPSVDRDARDLEEQVRQLWAAYR